MSYTIKKSDGTTLATVPENDIVLNAASVALIGRGATNYGAAHSEAFVHLLENFAHATPPAHPMTGQLWFDTNLGALKVFKAGAWELIGGGGGGGTGGGGSGDSVGGPIFVEVVTGGVTTSVIALVAGGQVVAAIASRDIPSGDLPETIRVLNQTIPFRARFPNGLEGGLTLAFDGRDYVYKGHVPEADKADYVGGGTPFGATAFCDLGSATVTLSISNNQIVGAFSQIARAQNTLPSNYSVGGQTMPFASVFPTGLRAGLTLANGFGIGVGSATITGSSTGVTLEQMLTAINEEQTARASAFTSLYAYADSTYAQAGLVNSLNATFLSATGQTSIADAVNWLVATAGSGTANAQYAVDLKAEVSSAIDGSTDFAHALQLINAAVGTDYASAADITDLETRLLTDQGEYSTRAFQRLTTNSTGTPKVAVATATSENITLSGEQTINGVLTNNSRVIVKDQTDKATNGIYITATGAWSRAADMDSLIEANGAFVMVSGGTLVGTAWLSTAEIAGTLGTSEITWEQVTLESAVARFQTVLNAQFEAETGYTSVANAIDELKTIATGDGAISVSDTDLRTRITTALAPDNQTLTIDQAFAKLKTLPNDIKTNKDSFDNLVFLIKGVTDQDVTVSTATAVQKLVSESKLSYSLGEFRTTLESDFAQSANDLTNGTATTFASALADVIQKTSSDGTGSTSSIDTDLRAAFINATKEGAPTITLAEMANKLMTNTTKDRALAESIAALEAVFTNGLTTTIAGATQKLSTVATQAKAGSDFVTTLSALFQNETGKGSLALAVDHLAAKADEVSATATKVTEIETTFKTATGQSTFASAVSTLWSRATDSGTSVGYSLSLNNNGYIMGMQLVNDGAGSSSKNFFRVAADRFIVADPSDPSPIPAFEVVGGAAYIKGEKIQSGTVTSAQVSLASYASETNMLYWQPTNEVVFGAGTVPANSRAIVTLSMSGKQTNSNSDSYYMSLQRYSYDAERNEPYYDYETGETLYYYVPAGYSWKEVQGQRSTINFNSTRGLSQSWTFIDNGITNEMASGEIRYRFAKTNRNAGGGHIEVCNMTALMVKK